MNSRMDSNNDNVNDDKPLKSILLSPRYTSSSRRLGMHHHPRNPSSSAADAAATTTSLPTSTMAPVVGEVVAEKNFRNFYARRRPTLIPPSPRSLLRPCRPVWMVASSDDEDDYDSEYSDDDSDSSYCGGAGSGGGSRRRRRRVVQFCSKAIVYEIPTWKSYSDAEKRAMWVPRKERKERMMINTVEFNYDGRDWRNATEEEEFGTDETTGALVHPAHVVNVPHNKKPANATTAKMSTTSSTSAPPPKKRRCCFGSHHSHHHEEDAYNNNSRKRCRAE